MNNPLVQKVDQEFRKLQIHGAELVRESFDEQNFGNALAVYKLGNLYFNFVRDRGHDTVDFQFPARKAEPITFSDLSLVMGWTTLDWLIEKYKTPNFDEPPPGPIPLVEALALVKKDFERLQLMFSPAEIGNTFEKLKEASEKRRKAIFG